MGIHVPVHSRNIEPSRGPSRISARAPRNRAKYPRSPSPDPHQHPWLQDLVNDHGDAQVVEKAARLQLVCLAREGPGGWPRQYGKHARASPTSVEGRDVFAPTSGAGPQKAVAQLDEAAWGTCRCPSRQAGSTLEVVQCPPKAR